MIHLCFWVGAIRRRAGFEDGPNLGLEVGEGFGRVVRIEADLVPLVGELLGESETTAHPCIGLAYRDPD